MSASQFDQDRRRQAYTAGHIGS